MIFAVAATALLSGLLAGCVSTSHHAASSEIPETAKFGVDVTPTPQPPSTFRKFAPLAPAQATYAQNAHLTPKSAEDRLTEIESTYQVGELLSPADAEFVRIVAAEAPAMADATEEATQSSEVPAAYIQPVDSMNFNKSGSLSSATGNVRGSETMNYNGIVSGTWSASFVASGNSSVKKVTAVEHVRMYGLIGTSGIGVVYSADPSSTVSGTVNNFSRSASFTALAAYYTMDYDGTFYTSNSSFNVTG
jgi:hypothetical protein